MLYDSLYCGRGQAENLIKLQETQLASDRTSCRSAIVSQFVSCCAPPPIGRCYCAQRRSKDAQSGERTVRDLAAPNHDRRPLIEPPAARLAFVAGSLEANLFRSRPGAHVPLGLRMLGHVPTFSAFKDDATIETSVSDAPLVKP